jgi:hypothetical protein
MRRSACVATAAAICLGFSAFAAGPGGALGTPTVDVGDVTIAEGDGGRRVAIVVATLSEPSAEDTVVTYELTTTAATAGRPVDPGADFWSPYYKGDGPKDFVIPAGSTRKPVRFLVFGDTEVEGDEVVTIEVLGVSPNAALGDGAGTMTIVDDDADASLRVAVGDASVHEGDDGTRLVAFSVTLSAPAPHPVEVDVATVDGSATGSTIDARNDYRPRARTMLLNTGQRGKVFVVPIYPDLDSEGDETFTVEISTSDPAVVVADGSGTGTIIDND